MAWDPSLNPLRNALAQLYPTRNDCVRILDSAGVARTRIDFNVNSVNMWHGCLTEATHQGRLSDLVAVAANEYPNNEEINRASIRLTEEAIEGIDPSTVDWRGPESWANAEILLSAMSSLVPIWFLQQGWGIQKSVSRIRVPKGSATGFLTSSNLLVTNHHVIPTKDVARKAIAEFNYQLGASGKSEPVTSFLLAPEDGFATSEEQDWTVVRVQGEPNSEWGAIPIEDRQIMVGDRVNIIQHPGGRPKEISFYHNLVRYVDDTFVQYLTDTEKGSSGSPVFDRDWNFVALHHGGGLIPEPETSRSYYRNQGIQAARIAEGVSRITG